MSEALTKKQQHVFDEALALHGQFALAPTPSEEWWGKFVENAFSESEQRYKELAAGWDETSDPIARDADDLLSPLGRARDEPTHTLVLAHLLDPRGTHGLRASFLRELIERATKLKVDATDVRIVAERSATLQGSSSASHRQRVRLDLWVEIRSDNLLVVIENKIDAEESDAQLKDYDEAIKACRPGDRDVRRILLTPHADRKPLTSDLWTPMSYFDLSIALRRAMRDGPSKYPYAALYLATILREIVRVPRSDGAARRAKIAAYLDGFKNGAHS